MSDEILQPLPGDLERADARHGGGQSQLPLDRQHAQQAAAVTEWWIGELGNHFLVAAAFAFETNPLVRPPDERMKPPNALCGGLQQPDKTIAATNMGQFVRTKMGSNSSTVFEATSASGMTIVGRRQPNAPGRSPLRPPPDGPADEGPVAGRGWPGVLRAARQLGPASSRSSANTSPGSTRHGQHRSSAPIDQATARATAAIVSNEDRLLADKPRSPICVAGNEETAV